MSTKTPPPIGTEVQVEWTRRDYFHAHMKEFQEFLDSSPVCYMGDASKDPRKNIHKANTWPGYSYVVFQHRFRDSEGILDVPGVIVSNAKIKGI